MAKYACSPEGVLALNNAASRIIASSEELSAETSTMRSVADEYGDTLGPHKTELNSALDGIAGALARCIEPANNVSEMLREVADGYEEVIGQNPYGSLGN
ncbi:MAG: WXG100 family type VII secretion target [Lachnospiraceae bacterium]|nr:WXG100 family type VII secretion target [Lachnospiraceae bacterium]